MTKDKIVIIGSYGVPNWGDELILSGLIEKLSAWNRRRDFLVLSGDPRLTHKLHQIKSLPHLPLGLRSLLNPLSWIKALSTLAAIWQSKRIIIGGGGLFQDEDWKAVPFWCGHILICKLLGKDVKVVGVSVGPLKHWWNKLLVRWSLSLSNGVNVRDRASQRLLKIMKIDSVVMEDLATYIPVPKNNFKKKSKIIIAIRPHRSLKKDFIPELAKLADTLSAKGEILFVTMQEDIDLAIAEQVKQAMKNKSTIISPTNILELIQIYQSAKLVIGMRLHSLILAHIVKTPVLAIPYSDKVFVFSREKYIKSYIPANKFNANEAKRKLPVF